MESAARQWMSAEALSRFGAVKAAFPEKAVQVAAMIVKLAEQGQLNGKVSDAELKQLLMYMSQERREVKIRRV